MRVRFLSGARREFAEAEEKHEAAQEDLGAEYYSEVTDVIAEIVRNPARFPAHGKGFRRALVNRFRHAVIFQERADEIVIVAIMHTSRRPGYWLSRVAKK